MFAFSPSIRICDLWCLMLQWGRICPSADFWVTCYVYIHSYAFTWQTNIILKADSHIACRSPAMPCVNSHMQCRAPALLRQCLILRECPHDSRKYPNCWSNSVTDRLFCSVLLPLFFSSMTNGIWFHTGHLQLRLLCV